MKSLEYEMTVLGVLYDMMMYDIPLKYDLKIQVVYSWAYDTLAA